MRLPPASGAVDRRQHRGGDRLRGDAGDGAVRQADVRQQPDGGGQQRRQLLPVLRVRPQVPSRFPPHLLRRVARPRRPRAQAALVVGSGNGERAAERR